MKEIWNDMKKYVVAVLITLVIGLVLGSTMECGRIFNDCRYAGVTRIGTAAFKCEQFSKAVLLTPDEVVKK